jgi:hypothetical protein
LLGCAIKLFNALCRFAGLDFEGSSTLGSFLSEDALCLANGSHCFGVARDDFLLVPGNTVITAP